MLSLHGVQVRRPHPLQLPSSSPNKLFFLGTGGAGIAGSLAYLLLRYMFDAKVSLIVCSPLPAAILLCYFFLLTSPGNEFHIFFNISFFVTTLPP